jgi:hypothetical protein
LGRLFGERSQSPQALLPTDGWCEVTGVARMSLVWPWYSHPDPTPLVDSYGRTLGVAPLLELRAPRSDRDVVLLVWAEPGGGFTIGPDWGESVGKLYARGRIQSQNPILLGGLAGRVARVGHGSETTWRLIVPRPDDVVQLETTVPTAHADAYWAQIESMLATWGWVA